jgi:hypothetical protein
VSEVVESRPQAADRYNRMKSIAIAVSLVACVQMSQGSDIHRSIVDSMFQSTKDSRLHGYRDSTKFTLHGYALGEASLRVVLDQASIVDSTLILELSGRVSDAMTGESVGDVLITVGTIDSVGSDARILSFEHTRTSKAGGFKISSTVSSGSRMVFAKAGYLVAIFEIDRLARK